MLRSPLGLLAGLVLFHGHSSAQTCLYTWGSDPGGAGSGAALLDPAGVGNVIRRQLLVPAVVFQNVPTGIAELSVVTAPAGYRRLRFDELTIRMGHTNATQLSTTFAQNVTSPLQTVLSVRDHVWFEGFGPAWVPVGLQTPFLFLPGSGNLLIEVVVLGGETLESLVYQSNTAAQIGSFVTATGQTVPTAGVTSSPPRLRLCVDRAESLLLGESCQGSGTSTPLLGVSGRPVLGSTPTIWLSDAPPNAIAACAFGFNNAPLYPINLTPLGAPGCREYFAIAFTDLVLANPLGVAQKAVPIPNSPSAMGFAFYAQYYVLDPPANALDLTASNYARLLCGL